MSNPLRLIRKYQKRLMVVFGVLLMLAFIVGGALTTATRPDGAENDGKRKVVSWKGGKVSRQELSYLKRQHVWSQAFLNNLANYAFTNEGRPRVNVNLMPVAQEPDQGDRDMMRILMMARRAEEMGMVVSDEAVLDFLASACDQELNEADFKQMISDMTNDRSDLFQITQHMKTELLAVNMFTLTVSGFSWSGQPVVTPIQALAYETRQYRTARLQLVEYDVEEYLSRVKDSPSNAEIRRLYEEGRFDFVDPFGEKPGFKKPRQLSVEWVKPDLSENSPLRPAPETISDEAIQARYDEWAADPTSPAWEIVAPTNPNDGATDPTGDDAVDPDGDTTTDPDNTTGDDATGDDTTGDDTTGDGTTGDDTTGSDDTDTGTDDTSGDDTSGDDTSGDDTSGDDTTGGDTTGDDTTGGDTSGDSQDDQSRLPSNSNRESTQYVSLPGQDGVAVDQWQVQDPVAGRPPRPVGVAPVQPDVTPPEGIGTGDNVPNPITNLQEPRLKPLEEVRDQIISALQDEAAQERARDVIAELERDYIEPASDAIFDWEYDQEDDEDSDKPRPKGPNIEKFAAENGLVYGSTDGLVDLRTFADTELAQLMVFDMNLFQMLQQIPTLGMLVEMQFDNLRAYTVEVYPDTPIGDVSTPEYVYWYRQVEQPYSPDLDECRDEVIRFWKMQKARDLAEADARKVADRARKNSESFLLNGDVSRDVMITDRFPWLSVGSGNLGGGGGQLEITRIRVNRDASEGAPEISPFDTGNELEGLGDDFMAEVFQLAVGESTVASSVGKDKVYAIYMMELGGMEPEGIIERVVRRTTTDQFSGAIANAEQTRYLQEWLRDLEDEMELAWLDE